MSSRTPIAPKKQVQLKFEQPESKAKKVKTEHTSCPTKAAISGMLGVLKYRSKKEGEEAAAAQQALAVYEGLEPSQKREFVSKWFTNGGAQQKCKLKWLAEYREQTTFQSKQQREWQEGYFTLPQIAGFIGLTVECAGSLTDFRKLALEEAMQNQRKHQHQHEPQMSASEMWQLDRYWYKHVEEVKGSNELATMEQMSKSSTDSKTIEGMIAAGSDGEQLGAAEGAKLFDTQRREVKHLSKVLATLQGTLSEGQFLVRRVRKAGETDEVMQGRAKLLSSNIEENTSWVDLCMDKLTEAESLSKETANHLLSASSNELSQLAETALTRHNALKECFKRYAPMLK